MSLHTFLKHFCTTCYSEIKTKSFEPNYTNFELFEKTKQNKQTNKKQANKQTKQQQKTPKKKNIKKKYFWQSIDAILEDISVAETIV